MLALVLALTVASPAAEVPSGSPLTLPVALRLLRERGFDRLLAELQVQVARGDAQAASASANPQLSGGVGHSFGVDAEACAGCSATSFNVSLSDQAALWDVIMGKKGLRSDAAKAAIEAAEKNRDAALRGLELQLKQAFAQALLAQKLSGLAHDASGAAERMRELDEKRRSAGAIGEAELARVEVQALQTLQLEDQAQAQLDAARATLRLLLGDAPEADGPLDPAGLDFALPPSLAQASLDALVKDAVETRPDLGAARAQVQRADAAATLARRQRIPDLALSLGYAQQGTGATAITPPTLTLGLSLPLPLFDQQQGQITHAEADARSQQVSLQRLEAQTRADVRQAFSAWTAARNRVQRDEGTLLSRARRVRELVDVQWTKGAASLLDQLDAQRTWLSIESDHLQDLAAYWTAVAQLEAAVGKELRP
ncbi:MAG: TolC family protein [Deltaproteobacteria bacterium]|nr:TolC family protein [Deltaproteobacteria bacterium]